MNTKSYYSKLERKYGRMTFALALKSWREAEGISQSEFAKRLRLSVQNLNDLERGRKIPSPSRAARIAKALGVPEAALIQLALRDSLAKEGLNFRVTLESA